MCKPKSDRVSWSEADVEGGVMVRIKEEGTDGGWVGHESERWWFGYANEGGSAGARHTPFVRKRWDSRE